MFSWYYPPWGPRFFLSSMQTTITPNKPASNSSTPAWLHWPSRGNYKKEYVAFEHISQANGDKQSRTNEYHGFLKRWLLKWAAYRYATGLAPYSTVRVSRYDEMQSGIPSKRLIAWVNPLWDGNLLCGHSWSGGICNAMWTVNALMLSCNPLTNNL